MEEARWLLPFTYGVDMRAIDLVINLAENAGALLVPVSLVYERHAPQSRGARLEHIQQSKDFLEAVQWKANRYHVAVERYEVFTADLMQSIPLLVADLHCDTIVLVTMQNREVFLQTYEFKQLLESPPAALVIIRLSAPSEDTQLQALRTRFLSWLRGIGRFGSMNADDSRGRQQVPEEDGPSWIRREGYSSRRSSW
jgi:hypothetical protein